MQRHVELNSCSILAVAACVLVLYFGTATTPIHRINNVRHSRVQVQFRSDSPRDGGPLNSTAELQAAVASTRLRNNTQLAQDAYTTSALANLTQFRAGVLSAGLSFFGVSKASAGRDGAPSLWNLLGPIVHCPTNSPLTRYGGSGDGGKLLCKLPPTSDTACVIYSLGSNGDFSFEQSMLQQTTCEVITFDCTFNGTSQGPRHTYHKWCLGDQQDGADFRTWANITASLGHSKVDVLKIDIEGYEYKVLADFSLMDKDLPHQIVIEFHFGNNRVPVMAQSGAELALAFLHLAQLGYAQHSQEANDGFPECCSEFSFLKVA